MERIVIVAALLLSSCIGTLPDIKDTNNCGMVIAGDLDVGKTTLTMQDLNGRLQAMFNVMTFVSDPDLFVPEAQCQKLVGVRVYTKSTRSFKHPYKEFNVGGLAYCSSRMIVVGTPDEGDWGKSSIIHEIFHILQNCKTPGTPDRLNDTEHANWDRYGIYEAIEVSRDL